MHLYIYLYKDIYFIGDNMIKNYFKSFIYFISIILIGSIIVTIFHYFSLLNLNIINILNIILSIISIFISSFILGKQCKQKGYLEGLKFGIIIILFITIINLFLHNLTLKIIIFYLILLITSILGSMIGITKHKDN